MSKQQIDYLESVKLASTSGTFGNTSFSPILVPDNAAVLYACRVCDKTYPKLSEALACQRQPFDDGGWKPGDTCIVPGQRCWHGIKRPDWVAYMVPADQRSSSHFDHSENYHPWFVVTCVYGDKSNPHLGLVTLATLVTGHLVAGWNPANGNGHCALFRPGLPEAQQRGTSIGSNWFDYVGSYILAATVPASIRDEVRWLGRSGLKSHRLL